eukprot:4637412-Karenia_brevis.AAC.1
MSSPVLFGCVETACDAKSLAAGTSSPVLFGGGDLAFDAKSLAAGTAKPVLFDQDLAEGALKDFTSQDLQT